MKNRFAAVSHGFIILLCFVPLWVSGQQGRSQWVWPGEDGTLQYKTTERGDRIMDFSYAGYMGGGVALPDVQVKITLQPLPDGADCTALIRNAIDAVSAMPLDGNGFRGTVLLSAGIYPCSGTIDIAASGVVLRGSGRDGDGSVIVMSGSKHTAIVVTAPRRDGVSSHDDTGGAVKVTDAYLPSGSMSLTVADASGFSAGDNILVRKPVTGKWVKYLEMDDLVRDGKPQTWIQEGRLLSIERRVACIEGNRLVLDAPLTDSYDAQYTNDNTTVVKTGDRGRVSRCGVENLRVVSPPQAVNHSQALYYAIRLNGEDCWLRDIDLVETMESVGVGGRRHTIRNVNVIRKAMHQGASKPAEFAPNGTQLLFENCSVEGDNIWYVAVGGGQSGPIVFLNCNFRGNGRIEGHQRWSCGFLFDNCHITGGGIDFKNRGSMGSGHGWGTAWAVAWNCEAKNYVNQMPPGTCNWVIGSTGKSTPLPRPFDREPNLPEGIFDSHGVNVAPRSLYMAQLEERLGR